MALLKLVLLLVAALTVQAQMDVPKPNTHAPMGYPTWDSTFPGAWRNDKGEKFVKSKSATTSLSTKEAKAEAAEKRDSKAAPTPAEQKMIMAGMAKFNYRR